MVIDSGKKVTDRGSRSSFSGLNVTRIKVYVKANGEELVGVKNHGKALVVERDWTFEEFLSFASRKIDMMNATRAFTSLGNATIFSVLVIPLLISFLIPWITLLSQVVN